MKTKQSEAATKLLINPIKMTKPNLLILSSSLSKKGNEKTIESVRKLAEAEDFGAISEMVSFTYAVIYLPSRKETVATEDLLRIPGVRIIQAPQESPGIYGALNTAFIHSMPDLLYVIQDDIIIPDAFISALRATLTHRNTYSHFWFPVYDEFLGHNIIPSDPSRAMLGPLGKHQGLILDMQVFNEKEINSVFCQEFKILGDINQHFRVLCHSKHFSFKDSSPIAFCCAGGISEKKSIRRLYEAIYARVHQVKLNDALKYLALKILQVSPRLILRSGGRLPVREK